MPVPLPATTLRRHSFARLNLKCNPFGELPREERIRAARVDLKDLERALHGPRSTLQLLADHGRGKSTHLLALWGHRFPASPYVQLHAGDRLPNLVGPPDAPCFVDSVENLPRRERADLFRLERPLAFTTHRDLSREVLRERPHLHTHLVALADPRELRDILEARLEAARRRPGPLPGLSEDRIRSLFTRWRGDVRAIEQELYLEFEELRRGRPTR